MAKENDESGTDSMDWLLGCQVMPWFQAHGLEMGLSEEGRACLPTILDSVAAAGFTAFEVVAPAVPIEEPQALLDKMSALPLRFAGGHVWGPFWQPHASAAIPAVIATASQLKSLGCESLVVTMAPFITADADATTLAVAAENLCELGRACFNECGMPVVYHNHATEMANNAAVSTRLCKRVLQK